MARGDCQSTRVSRLTFTVVEFLAVGAVPMSGSKEACSSNLSFHCYCKQAYFPYPSLSHLSVSLGHRFHHAIGAFALHRSSYLHFSPAFLFSLPFHVLSRRKQAIATTFIDWATFVLYYPIFSCFWENIPIQSSIFNSYATNRRDPWSIDNSSSNPIQSEIGHNVGHAYSMGRTQ